MRVALFGGTGFVGSHIVERLLAAGHEPVLLVRPGSENKVPQAARCFLVAGDIGDRAAIAATLAHCDALIYLIGILREEPDKGITFQALQFEGARRVIDAAAAAGVRRVLLMSANGVSETGTAYATTKYAAEEYLRNSGLDGTVFRPSVIFGDPHSRMEFATQLLEEMIAPPIPAPAFFRGVNPKATFAMTPVHVEDVANAFVAALSDPETIGQTFPLGGAVTLSWPDIIRTIAAAGGRRKLVLPAPAAVVHAVAAVFDRFRWFPITRDQLTMLLEGNTVDDRRAFARFGIDERAFSVETLDYLAA